MKNDICITKPVSFAGRSVYMNQDGRDLVIVENGMRVVISPEEMAYIMLSASGQFIEYYNAEIDRLAASDNQ